MHTNHYDLLRNTWIYQEIKQQVQAEEQQRSIIEHRQALLAIVQARFPRLVLLATEVSIYLTDLDSLRDLLIKTGAAQREKEVRQHLMEKRKDRL